VAGNRHVAQDDFSAGVFINSSLENIPRNGLADAMNLLVEDDRALRIRGGSRWAAPALGAGSSIYWMWSGVIGSTQRTIVANGSGVAASDDSANTTSAIAAASPGRGPAVSLAGYLFMPQSGVTLTGALAVGAAPLIRQCYAVAGNRLWAADINSTRVDFSDVGTPGTFGATSFHQIAEGGILGLMGLRDAVVVFTTAGVWVISNVGANLTDGAGNVQHRIDRYSRGLILWDANGLGAAYEGALVVPARDGVYLMSYGVASEAPQAFTLISGPISTLYRSYVAAGYIPGQPTVYRGTLLLPIRTSAGAFIDLLACRLDMPGFPWTRISHEATGPLTVARSIFTSNLIGGGVGDDRLMTLDYFDRSLSTTDADAQTWPTFALFRAAAPPSNQATLVRFRLGYEQTGGTGTAASYQTLLGVPEALSGTAGDNSLTERAPHTWRVARPAKYASVMVEQAGQPSVFKIKSAEWFIRDRGRV
jgi:hypothetical protein